MPLPKGTRYRMVERGGHQIRLAFGKGGTVLEAKNMTTGATHSPAEFEADRRRKKQREHDTMNAMIRGAK